MSRTINGHIVFGKAVIVRAKTEEEAKMLAIKGKSFDHYPWQAKKLFSGTYEVYIAKDCDAFATND